MTNNEFLFTNREQYLSWRADWRAAYAKLSASIRTNKNDRSTLAKSGQYVGITQSVLVRQRIQAADMMEERIRSKNVAAMQYRQTRIAKAA